MYGAERGGRIRDVMHCTGALMTGSGANKGWAIRGTLGKGCSADGGAGWDARAKWAWEAARQSECHERRVLAGD